METKRRAFSSAAAFVLIISTLLLNGSFAFAQGNNTNTQVRDLLENQAHIVKPGMLPNSFWYWAENFGEEIRFLVTIGKQKKADYLIELSQKRLAEMQALSQQGINDYANQLLTEHDAKVEHAQQLYQQVKDDAVKQAQQLQVDTEKQILKQSAAAQRGAAAAPGQYNEQVNGVAGAVNAWFAKVLEHLKWKRGQINNQKAELGE